MAKDRLPRRLAVLRADYESVRGHPFDHFFCPYLFRDEATALCLGHVVNQAFGRVSRRQVPQRKDVDGFYGAHFESEFVLLRHRGKVTAREAIADPDLTRRLGARIEIDGTSVPFYHERGEVPPQFTRLEMERPDGPPVSLVLKMTEDEVLAAQQARWQLTMSGDVRLPTLVSLLKAAHLTLFARLGYRYALSAAGHFLGREVLGEFFLRYGGRPHAEVLAGAAGYFAQYSALVRPLALMPDDLKGTVTDGYLQICPNGDRKWWALLVFIRTGESGHAVLVPVFEEVESAVRFVNFLSRPAPRFDAHLAQFQEDRWAISPKAQTLQWPPGRFDEPLGEGDPASEG